MKALRLVEDIILKKGNALTYYVRYLFIPQKQKELFRELMEVNGQKIL